VPCDRGTLRIATSFHGLYPTTMAHILGIGTIHDCHSPRLWKAESPPVPRRADTLRWPPALLITSVCQARLTAKVLPAPSMPVVAWQLLYS
jgi:hypothetical protein